MQDPIHALICQPAVDVLGIDPKGVARTTADVFLLVAITLSGLKVASLDPVANPGVHVHQAMHVTGAMIVYAWMRFVIANGAAGRAGSLGMLHAGMRIMFLSCAAADMVDMYLLLSSKAAVAMMAMARSSLQTIEDMMAGITLYLSICDGPPPVGRRDLVPEAA